MHAEQRAHRAVSQHLPVAIKYERWDLEHRFVSHHHARGHHCGERCHDEQSQVCQLGVAEEDDLLREHQAAHRRIERRRDAGARSCRDQHFRPFRSSFLNCATAEPMAPPTCAMGPSRPTDHPEPSESAAPAALTKIHPRLMRALPRFTCSRKFGNPYPRHVAAKNAVKQKHAERRRSPSTSGIEMRKMPPREICSTSNPRYRNTACDQRMSARNPRLPSAASMPTTAASKDHLDIVELVAAKPEVRLDRD